MESHWGSVEVSGAQLGLIGGSLGVSGSQWGSVRNVYRPIFVVLYKYLNCSADRTFDTGDAAVTDCKC